MLASCQTFECKSLSIRKRTKERQDAAGHSHIAMQLINQFAAVVLNLKGLANPSIYLQV